MSDLTYSWQYYVYNIVFGASFRGDLTGDEDQITLGLRSWAQVSPALGEGMTITYAFGTGHPGPVYFDDMDGIGDFIEEPMSEELRAIARKVFDDISSFTNLTFVEVSSSDRPDLQFFQHDGTLSYGEMLYGYTRGVNVVLSNQYFREGYEPDHLNTIPWEEILRHEIGHVLGLSHPENYHDPEGATFEPEDHEIPWHEETVQFSVMSYFRHAMFLERDGLDQTYIFRDQHGFDASIYAESYGLYDIKALQFLYGANEAPTAGDDTYVFHAEGATIRTVYDSSGTDTFDLSNQTLGTDINLAEASFSSIGRVPISPTTQEPGEGDSYSLDVRVENNVAIAWDTVIENVIGSDFDDIIEGNTADNELKGGGGNDTLDGGAGSDRLYGGTHSDNISGGTGNDVLYGDHGADTLDGGDGTDAVQYLASGTGVTVNLTTGLGSSGQAAGDVLSNIENINGSRASDHLIGDDGNNKFVGYGGWDTLEGGAGDDRLEGWRGKDVLAGGDGDDYLFGGTDEDTLTGGAGNDTLVGGTHADLFIFSSGSGEDVITDFEADLDRLDLSTTATDFTDLASLQAATSEVDGGILIDLGGGDTLLLQGLTLGDLEQIDFIF